ncbi:hypothetical protein Q1695_000884 [Nippostrongylus brasiliensis]|nr:hypothetical protein Q1695_000884 [Nippostrongylus brasiliensis]
MEFMTAMRLLCSRCIDLFARTQRGIALIKLDVTNFESKTTLLVPNIPEELSVLLTADGSGTGYYTLRSHLYSLTIVNSTSTDLGRIGYGLEEAPSSIAFDWITRKIFISLSGVGHDSSARVYACSIKDSSNCTVVIYENLDYLHSLCLDPLEGNIYWLNGITNCIEKSFMNGQHHDKHPYSDQAVSSSKDVTYSSLTLDLNERRIYFVRTQRKSSQIWYCELYRRDSCAQLFDTDPIQFFTLFQSYFIWSTSYRGELIVCEKLNCENTYKTIGGVNGVESLVAVDPSIQPNRTNPNPCSDKNGGCSHFCLLLNFHPWSQCSCPVGIKLLSDGKTCDPRGINKILFISAVSGIYYISLDTSDFTPKQVLFEGLNNDGFSHKFYDIDFDPVGRKIYWIDASMGQIRRCSVEGYVVEDVLSIPSTVRVFRLDYLSRNIYWVDTDLNRIYVTKLDTTYTRPIISRGVNKLHTIALDLRNRHLYFSDGQGAENRIERCNLDGSDRVVVVTLASYAWPNGIVVNPESRRLYWTEGNYSVVKTAFLNGTEQKVIGPASLRLPQPYAISALDQELFCNSLAGRALMRISTNVETGALMASVIESSIYGPIGLVAVSLHTKVISDNRCARMKCMHLCVLSSEGVPKCLCSVGYELTSDERSCRKPTAYFVIVQKSVSDISRASLEKPLNFESLGVLNVTESPTTVDIDQRGSYIVYGYSSSTTGYIKRVSFTGIVPEIVISDPSLVGMHSLSVDWISRNIYWSNPARGRIEVCDHTGRYRRTLASHMIRPTSLLVHPLEGAVFYVNQHANITIRRMPLSGDAFGGRDIVGDLASVTSLTIDFRKNLLYWTEVSGLSSSISAARLDGLSRQLIYGGTDHNPHLLFHFNHRLYYTDQKRKIIGFHNERELVTLHENVSDVTSLLIHHGRVGSDSSPCTYELSDCPQLCLATSRSERQCVCSDHFVFDQYSLLCKAPENVIVAGSEEGFVVMNLRRLPDQSLSYNEDPMVHFMMLSVGVPQSMAMDTSSRLIFWIDAKDPGRIKYSRLTFPVKASVFPDRHNCSIFHSLAMDENGRALYASCHSRASVGYVYVFAVKDTLPIPLELIGTVVSGNEISLATGHAPVPRDITVLPQSNYLFYVDVSPFLPSPAIIQCQLDGRKCEAWLSKDLWPGTRIYVDPTYLRLFYTCPSGIWSRDVGVVSSNVRHHYVSSVANDYSVAPLDESTMLVAQISSYNSTIIELPSNSTVELPKSTSILQRFIGISSRVCREASCSHLCRFLRDSKQKYECICPLGYAISSDNPSTCLPNVRCNAWEFACDDGQSCVHSAKKCDRVPDCSDGSDESPTLCRNVGPNQWPCDDSASTIDRDLLCNGQLDCEDGSDERHCRCSSPSSELDCGAFPLVTGGECVNRRLACDGFPDCENGADENPKMCANYPDLSGRFQSSPEWLYILLLGFIILSCTIAILFCCFRNYPICGNGRLDTTSSLHHMRGSGMAEASILLPPAQMGAQVEVALRAYSVVTSTNSSYPALPPPNSTRSLSRSSTSRNRSDGKDIPLNRFYAPPPSAASLSTYGVVKPAEVRISTNSRQRPRRKKVSSPPPSYTQLEDPALSASVAGLMSCRPQMSSTPKSRTPQSSKRMGITPRRSPPHQPPSDYLDHRRRPSSSSSSLSSHSSDEAFI